MRSKINTLADFHDAPFERKIVLSCPPEHMEKKLRAVTRAGKQVIDVTRIEAGDVVTLSAQSSLPKFNKPSLVLTVGGGLFDKAFEQQLLGREAGESFTAQAQDTPVEVTVRTVRRTIFPEPSDELAKKYAETHDGFDGVETLEQYKARVTDAYLEEAHREAYYETLRQVVVYVLSHTDFDFDESEIEDQYQEELKAAAESLKEQGIDTPLDDMSDEECRKRFGYESIAALKEDMHNGCEEMIATMLYSAALQGVDPADIDPETFDGYNFAPVEDYLKQELEFQEVR